MPTPAAETKLMRALRGNPTDRVPFWEVWFGMSHLAETLLGHPVTTLADRVVLARRLGWECLNFGVPARHPGSRYDTASDGTQHYVPKGKIPLDELYARPDPDLTEPIEQARELIRVAREEGLVAVAYVPWCFHAASTALGLETLSFLAYDDPDYLHALFEWVEEGSRRALREALIPLGVDLVLFDGDCAYRNGLMVNPRMFRDLVFDRTAKTVSLLRDAGIPYTFHSDGKVDDLLPILIELGFSGFHGVEAQANDLADVKRRFGRDITLIGNMDVVFLAHATPAEVRQATAEMLAIGMPGGRYIAACNTSPLDYIPQQNYLAFVDVIHNY